MIVLQGLIMLKGFVIILYLLTSTWLKSSADGQYMENFSQFSKANTRIPSHQKIYAWLDGGFYSYIWKAETHRVHKVYVKDKLLLVHILIVCTEGDIACSVPTAAWILGITWSPLMKQHIFSDLCKKLLLCVSHLLTAIISPEAHLHDVFFEWV